MNKKFQFQHFHAILALWRRKILSVSVPGALRSMTNACNQYNVFILFDFVHEVWKMFTLVKKSNCYGLHKVPQRWRTCVAKIICSRLFTIMILDPQTIYNHVTWVKFLQFQVTPTSKIVWSTSATRESVTFFLLLRALLSMFCEFFFSSTQK